MTETKTETAIEIGTIEMIPFTALVRDPKNVRTGKLSAEDKAEIRGIAANIEAQGLLQNLLVRKLSKGRYGVTGGGRRFAAMKLLVKQGKLSKETLVPCRCVEGDEAVEVSMSENLHRKDMHPADEFAAWHKLAKSGLSVDEIAIRHGTTVSVIMKRLRLGALSPAILKAFRADHFSLDGAMAFTLTSDYAEQKSVYTALFEKGLPLHARSIRNAITGEEIPCTHQLARFVGPEAFLAAGGTIREDLFGDDMFQDRGLLAGLADDKVAAEIKRLEEEGWAWIKQLDRFYEWEHAKNHRQLDPDETIIEAATQAKIAALEDQIETLIGGEDADEDQIEDLENDILALKGSQQFSDEQKAMAGGWISIARNGNGFEYHLGYVWSEDDPKQKKAVPNDGGTTAKDPYGKGLRDDLAYIRRNVLQCEFMRCPEIAADLFQFEIIHAFYKTSSVFDISVRHPHGRRIIGENGTMGELAGIEEKEAEIATLPLNWIELEDRAEAFDVYRALSPGEKTRLLAFVASHSLEAVLHGEDERNASLDRAAQIMQTDYSDYWTPDTDFFSRLPKGELLKIGRQTVSDEWADSRGKSKKTGLVAALGKAFSPDGSAALSKQARQRTTSWTPAPLNAGLQTETVDQQAASPA